MNDQAIDNVYFSGIVIYDEKEEEIKATTENDASTIMKKALTIGFFPAFDIYNGDIAWDKIETPESYIIFDKIVSFPIDYADNRPLHIRTVFDVTFVTKNKELRNIIGGRIRESLVEKGFFCIDGGRDLERESKYYAIKQEYAWIGGW